MNKILDSIEFSNIVTIRDKLAKIPDALRLDSGDPDFDTADHIKRAACDALRDNKTHYAPSAGIKELHEAIGLPSESVMVTNGGMHGLYCIFRTLLNKGDLVLVPRPNWTPVEQIIRLCGGIPISYDLDKPNLEEKLNKKFIKAIFVNSPHNPTGKILPYLTLNKITTFASKHNVTIVADEAYKDIIYVEGTEFIPMSMAPIFSSSIKHFPKIISCYTFSKSYAMTGWRLGYVTAHEDFIAEMKKMVLYSTNGVSTPVQYAGIAALKGGIDQTMIAEYKKRRNILYEGVLNCRYLTCELPKGAFYIYAYLTDLWEQNEDDFVTMLVNKGIGCIPGSAFGDRKPAIRFAYACSTKQIQEAAKRISNL